MAVTLVTYSKTTGLNSSTSASIDTSGANLLVGHVARYSAGGAVTVADSKTNTWNARTEKIGSAVLGSRIYDVTNPTVGTGHTFSTNGSVIASASQFASFSGCDISAPFDVENGATAAAVAALAPGSITPTNDGSLIWSGAAAYNGQSGTFANTSLTSVLAQDSYASGNNVGGAAGYVVLGAGTGGNPYVLNDWTWTGLAACCAVIAAYKAEASGGTSRPVKMAGRWSGYAGPSGGFVN